MIWKIIQSQQPGIYHITNPKPVSLAVLREIFVELFNITKARFVEEEDFIRKKANRYELMYKKASSFYQPYLRHEPIFDRMFTEQVLNESDLVMPEMNLEFFKRLINYARDANWGKNHRKTSSQPVNINPASTARGQGTDLMNNGLYRVIISHSRSESF
jgi:hypothetical protein